MKKKISVKAIQDAVGAPQYEFPKYTTQVINLVNGNAGGTRPKVVGQMSELIQEFPGKTIQEWIEWYGAKQPEAVDKATEKIYEMYLAMQKAFTQIDKELTFCGLKFQEAILKYIADELHVSYRLATIEEEAQNVDGYVNDKPVQIKATSYRLKNTAEVIEVPIIFYDKKKDGVVIEYNPADFQ